MRSLEKSATAIALNVAVIGHRPNRLGLSSVQRVRDELRVLIERIGQAAKEHGVRKVSPSAQRADLAEAVILTSLAEGADRMGADAALELGIPLHVVLPMPRLSYEEDFADGESRADFRAKLAAATRVIELDAPVNGQNGRDRAYSLAAEILLDHADILIAVWDGKPPGGYGGTVMTIVEGCARGLPVVVIDAAGAQPARLLWHGLEDGALPGPDIAMLPSRLAEQALDETVRRLIEPPADISGTPLKALQEAGALDPLADDGLASMQQSADQMANVFASRFRRAVWWNFVAAFCAISLAVIGLALLKDLEKDKKLLLLFVEAVLLGFIVANTWIGRKRDWHRRWLVYREVAEHLRIDMMLRAVAVRSPDLTGGKTGSVGWFVRDRLRKAGLPALHFDNAGLTKAKSVVLTLAHTQESYHAGAAWRAHKAERLNEGLGSAAFLAALVVCLVALAMTGTGMHAPGELKLALGCAAIVLPAFGSALLGIRMLADYAAVAERSGESARFFAEIIRHIENDPLDLRHLRVRARAIARFGLGDVDRWRVLAQSRKLDLPG